MSNPPKLSKETWEQLRDWLVPEEKPCPDMAIEALLRDDRQRLRALLTAEADRAERS